MLGLGKRTEALACYKKALQLTPDNPEIYICTGYIHFISGELGSALKSYECAIRLNPEFPDVYYSHGNVLQNLGRHNEAISAYEEALRRNPDNFKIYTNMGVSLAQVKRHDEAIAAFQKAVQLNPADVFAHKNWTRTLIGQGRVEEAEIILLNFLSTRGDDTEILLSLARMYERLNNHEQSSILVKKILKKEPLNPAGTRIMASLLRHQDKADEGVALLSRITIPTYDHVLAMEIHYEFGKLYDRQQEYHKAMQHFALANTLWKKKSTVAKENYLHQIVFTRQKYERQKNRLHDTIASSKRTHGSRPFFQVGFPRSGTTLLANILDTHQALQVLAEKPMLETVLKKIAAQDTDYPNVLLDMSDEKLEYFRNTYWEEARKLNISRDLQLIDEHPFNIVHCNLAARLFPDARIIVTLRHPCDVCLSCFMQSFEDNAGMVNFTTLSDTVDLYVEVIGLWLDYEQHLPLPIHRFRYEGLVENFDREMTMIADFLAIPWSDTFRNFNQHAKTKKIITTASYSQVAEPLYSHAKYRWLRYREYMEPYLPALRPFIEAFGYDDLPHNPESL